MKVHLWKIASLLQILQRIIVEIEKDEKLHDKLKIIDKFVQNVKPYLNIFSDGNTLNPWPLSVMIIQIMIIIAG